MRTVLSGRLLGALLSITLISAGCPSDDGVDGECVSTQKFFDDQVWSSFMQDNCFGCHNPQGQARTTDFVLLPLGVPGALKTNLATVKYVSAFEYEGRSILLLKPAAQMAHGGGERFPASSKEYAALESLIKRFKEPVACEEATDNTYMAGVVLNDDQQTLRKAALSLVGRLPRADEITEVGAGPEGLDSVLLAMMTEDAFFDTIEVMFNNKLLTNRYKGSSNATNLLSTEDYPNRRWYDEDSAYPATDDYKALGRTYANNAVATAPLRLIQHVIREDRPFTEILTADYMLVTPFSAVVYGVEETVPFAKKDDPTEWREVKLPGIPHAGLLTSPMYLNRFPTTDTNRNRHRSRMTQSFFLATDILKLAERPIDSGSVGSHNPTLNNPDCVVCHVVMDPVAGTFQNWGATGRFALPEKGWFTDMLAPGFGETTVPPTQASSSLRWVAGEITNDDRFALSITYWVFEGLTGQTALTPPTDTAHPEYESRKRAYDNQDQVLYAVSEAFKADNHSLKRLVLELVKSPYFRAIDTSVPVEGERAVDLNPVGTARFLTPEALDRKITATTGYPWSSGLDRAHYLLTDYRIFYGGIDSNGITKRITQPNGIMANVAWRMANEVSCHNVPRDFTRNRTQRLLFPFVETSFVPEDDNGFTVPGAKQAIKENIQHLHARLLGEQLALNDPEIERTYQLWYETWLEGKAAVAKDEVDDYMSYRCRAERDYYTGEDLPSAAQVRRDLSYSIRSWMAVVTYLLADYKFLHE